MNIVVLTPQVTLFVFALFILMCGLLFPRVKREVLAIIGLTGIILVIIRFLLQLLASTQAVTDREPTATRALRCFRESSPR